MSVTRISTWLKKAPRPVIAALALTAALLAMQPSLSAYASTFTVTSTADSGPGSLRSAIESANATTKKDTIKFSIPGAGPHTITITSANLPDIIYPVVIDGTTQPTFPGTIGVQINCNGWNGLTLAAGSSGSTVKGLAIGGAGGVALGLVDSSKHVIQGNYIGTFDGVSNENNDTGLAIINSNDNLIGGTKVTQGNLIAASTTDGIVLFSGSTGNKIQGNRIGVMASGSMALGNSNAGIRLEGAASNTIGGTTAGAGNLISGNVNYGILINGAGATGNVVQGNFIGTDRTGTLDLGNGLDGVSILGAPGNTIGGTTASARNIISGNNRHGVNINGAGATGNVVQGNFIGTDVTGTLQRGNNDTGVYVTDAPGNTIGGAAAGARNVISANSFGVKITGGAASSNTVQGNFIGVDATGAVDIGNASTGVVVFEAPDTLVGGAAPGAGNVISGNEGNGVFIEGTSITGTQVQGNFIGTDLTGTLDLGNHFSGVSAVSLTAAVTIGGTQPGQGNRIAYNEQDGISVTASSGLAIQGNRIENHNPGTGLRLQSGSISSTTMNCFGGNGIGMDNLTASSTTAEGNWWGATDGPSGGGVGAGDSALGLIDFDPFVTTSCEELLGQRVTNGGMEVDTDTNLLPDGWTGGNLVLGASDDGQDDTTFQSGLHSFRLKGNKKAKTLTQTILFGGAAGESITLSLYTSQAGLPGGGKFKGTLTVYHLDNSKQTVTVNLPTADSSFALTTAPTLIATEPYDQIDVKIEFTKKSGNVWIDDVSVLALP